MKEFLTVIFCIAALAYVEILIGTILSFRTDVFRKKLKPGDLCSIYVGAEKVKGRALKREKDIITIEDEDGELHYLPITSVYRF